MQYHIIIQARTGSKRLSNKIFKIINKRTVIDFLITRLLKHYPKDRIIIATTLNKKDNKIATYAKNKKLKLFRGSETNVMDRYVKCCEAYNVKNIVRITSDCPLLDASIISKIWKLYKNKKLDYISNTLPPKESTFPDGSDIEIFKFKTLNLMNKKKLRMIDREHVTNLFWKTRKYNTLNYKNTINISQYKYSLDYKEDLSLIKKIIKKIGTKEINYNAINIVNTIKKNNVLKKISTNSKKLFNNNRKDIYENNSEVY